jgi:hypothetical protein
MRFKSEDKSCLVVVHYLLLLTRVLLFIYALKEFKNKISVGRSLQRADIMTQMLLKKHHARRLAFFPSCNVDYTFYLPAGLCTSRLSVCENERAKEEVG